MGLFNKIFGKRSSREQLEEMALSAAFEKQVMQDGIAHAAKRIAEEINARIHSKDLAMQFVLEELDAARQGDGYAQKFAEESGFHPSEYIGAMSKTKWDGDESDLEHLQLLLRSFMFRLSDRDLMCKLGLAVVDEVMRNWNIGRYANSIQSTAKFERSAPNIDYANMIFDLLAKYAEQGDADAQYELGWRYYRKNQHGNASTWFSKAIENGHPEARATVIQLSLFIPAVSDTDADQLFADGLTYFFRSQYKYAHELILKAAEQGHEEAKQALIDFSENPFFNGKGLNGEDLTPINAREKF